MPQQVLYKESCQPIKNLGRKKPSST